MPYNTRRKSVSLTLLGIHVPSGPRQAAAHRSPPANTSATSNSPPRPDDQQQPPSKKIKRSHSDATAPRSPTSPSRSAPPKSKPERLPANTPPPSPGDAGTVKIDTEGIGDEVVVAVIEQLEKTGNRPHLLKELAAVTSSFLQVVESSANQSAIISSRLSSYMRRPWTVLSPCPIGKELIGTHPKRLYFFLTNQQRQPFPEPSEMAHSSRRIISPSLTSAADDEDQASRRRAELSPSPEIDLGTPDIDDQVSPLPPTDPFVLPHQLAPHLSTPVSFAQSRTSPALERDEREFTQTANALQLLRRSESMEVKEDALAPDMSEQPALVVEDESDESAALRDKEAADALFGHDDARLSLRKSTFPLSSPMLIPQVDMEVLSGKPSFGALSIDHQSLDEKMDVNFAWSDLKSPETVELDELDDMFASF